jgi:predicted ABC-type ATPase
VQSGGHNVPEGDIKRRFRRSLVNFDHLYKPMATTWRVYDGSSSQLPTLIASGARGESTVVIEAATWADVNDQVREHE